MNSEGSATTNFVFGAANWNQSRKLELEKLIACGANLYGKSLMIDTANAYKDSEKVIGSLSDTLHTFIVNTKFGFGSKEILTSSLLLDQFQESRTRLNYSQIGTLFLHSTDPSILERKLIKTLRELKSNGDIHQIGYSGDSIFLKRAIDTGVFDVFMSSFSPIDQANYESLSTLPSNRIYLKRVLGSGVFRNSIYKRLRRSLGQMRHEPWALKDHDYFYRLIEMNAHLDEPMKIADFLGYATRAFPLAKLVVGVSSKRHFEFLVKESDSPFNDLRFNELRQTWLQLKKDTWDPIT